MGVFSDSCHEKMWLLFKNHGHEVGSEYTGPGKEGKQKTNCIIYVSNVLIYACEKAGFRTYIPKIKQLGIDKQDGSALAKWLLDYANWKVHYWNQDVTYKGDGNEHGWSYKRLLDTKRYLPDNARVNLAAGGMIVDYNTRVKTKRVWYSTPVSVPTLPVTVPIPTYIDVSTENTEILRKLYQLKFAYGIARGATHTFLFSFGDVFEVHWDSIGAGLYGSVPFKTYPWLSGALLVPPDQWFSSDEIKAR